MSDSTSYLRRDTPVGRDTARLPDSGEAGRRRFARLVAIVLSAVLAVAFFSQRVPCGPSAGRLDVPVAAAPVLANEPAQLRIGTYNIHGCKGTDGVRDPARIAEVVRGADFVGLNEVHGPSAWAGGNQATTLGGLLGMTPLYAPTEDPWLAAQFGNGLLTRVAVDHWQVVPLPRIYGKSYRNLLHVQARAANGTSVNIVVTHLDRSDDRERREQLQTVGNYFLSLAAPAVLLGDLNSDAGEAYLRLMLIAPGVVDALSEKLRDQTPRHIDWILVRGATVADAGLTEAGPSDHPYVWADLVIPPVPAAEPR
jgi:endonuclease/exonuclease/phosphatase family metal-dependent hydrolase